MYRCSAGETEEDGRRPSSALIHPKPINMCFPWKTEIRTFTYLKAHFIHLFLRPTNNFLAAYWVPGPVPNTNYSFK